MQSGTRLIKIFISHLASFHIVRRSDFRKYDGKPFPGIDALLKGIAENVHEVNPINENAQPTLTQALLSAHLNADLQCHSVKRKRNDPNTPQNFNEACQFRG